MLGYRQDYLDNLDCSRGYGNAFIAQLVHHIASPDTFFSIIANGRIFATIFVYLGEGPYSMICGAKPELSQRLRVVILENLSVALTQTLDPDC